MYHMNDQTADLCPSLISHESRVINKCLLKLGLDLADFNFNVQGYVTHAEYNIGELHSLNLIDL